MWWRKIGCAPVVDADGFPRRLVTRTDIGRAALAVLQAEPVELLSRLGEAPHS